MLRHLCVAIILANMSKLKYSVEAQYLILLIKQTIFYGVSKQSISMSSLDNILLMSLIIKVLCYDKPVSILFS